MDLLNSIPGWDQTKAEAQRQQLQPNPTWAGSDYPNLDVHKSQM